MTYYTYILESIKNGGYYVGSTSNLKSRLKKHNKGDVKSTRFNRPWKIIYAEIYSSRKEAEKREKQIKTWKSRDFIQNLIEKNTGSRSSPGFHEIFDFD